ncbi:MAG: hypothetical protein IIZ70_02155 [Kiritimatiellae bacterium]|nr:hypothetical protein [Kiritimatiellia bacterium]
MKTRSRLAIFHYLSGAGMSGIRLRAGTDPVDAKRNRFLAVAGVAAAAWLVVLIWF